MPMLDCRLGIDVGGTNTDAVVLDASDRVLAKAKVACTPDIIGGITAVLEAVLRAPAVEPRRITHVMLGTTHATNAVLERRKLRRVGVIRIGAPATHAIRPLFDWPADLVDVICAASVIVGGGIEFDGREIVEFDREGTARFLAGLDGAADSVAITSVFAPVSPRHELLAAEIVRHELGDVHVSLSHEIGSVGLLERENATILNAALVDVARDVATAMTAALEAYDLTPEIFLAQNDGTLMAIEHALQHPVLTIGSGPANSIRGAAFLSGATDSLVADVGGTSTDIGVLVHGFPRESSHGVEIGGIRTNFRMPDLVTIALGGGSVVAGGPADPMIGPHSVGFRLSQQALVFGGQTPTLTDSAVAAGRAELGDPRLIGGHAELLRSAARRADVMLAEAMDRVKSAKGDRTLIAVGGGSILIPDRLPGISEVIRPENFDAANAVGAAIASVSGQVDRIFRLGSQGRAAILREATEEAMDNAVAAGAEADSVQIVEIEEIPLAYLNTPTVRIRVKAAGSLGGLRERPDERQASLAPNHQIRNTAPTPAIRTGRTSEA